MGQCPRIKFPLRSTFDISMRVALKVMHPVQCCWCTTSEADADGTAVVPTSIPLHYVAV